MSKGLMYKEALERIAKNMGISPGEAENRIKAVRESLSDKTSDCLSPNEWQSWRNYALPGNRRRHLAACAFCTKVSAVLIR
ncbi:hypothetical protein A3E06_02340 [Candidatus Giovannonibacteria bacterium RIFCSPHIGHO2_12_FULL_44_42]|nr:MAG: hypothetical protein UW28_C0036G0002 [Parcubacteria group bacterium GW2011_GWA2_44_13]OGF71850.1 MAG: hypothetical protein A3E06_02340 [Candidatus Giovannonibacteria bacterium RIFCSPHIGHO2_12_FULL_44_42]OGF88594.1 MAG: hypothetical protein A3I94_04095 [Candidatus Giovannonibacteria bacterium RIFCSPLOWO2_02_FULL_43_54]